MLITTTYLALHFCGADATEIRIIAASDLHAFAAGPLHGAKERSRASAGPRAATRRKAKGISYTKSGKNPHLGSGEVWEAILL